ncbi:MAG TPA: ABC transporter permease [Anaeromyxobacteraceae bacterium]|nr:ABC transporter permease [Anaeromyxobacteraceae bacterium]
MTARAGGVLWIARANLRSDLRSTLVNAAAATVGAAALAFFVALGLGVGDAARRMFPADARLVDVVPAGVSLGGVLGGGELDDAAVARLRALPGVEAAWPRLTLRVPIAAGQAPEGLRYNWPPGLTVQVPVLGVDPGLLAGAAEGGFSFEDPGDDAGPIPVMLSRRLIEVYNKTIAPSWNVRKLPMGLSLVGLQLPVQVGYSIVPQKTEDRIFESRLRLVGLSDRVPLYMLAMPLGTVRRLNREYGKVDAGYTQVTLLARRPEDAPIVAAAVRRMGFALDEGERATAERVGTVVAVTTLALALLATLMVALAALAIAQSLSANVRARAREIAILRAVGATPADVRGIILVEGGVVGLAGGLLGAAGARLAALGADRLAARLLPDFPFRPETFFSFPAWVPALAVAVALGAAILGALAPAALAARVDPARTLA